MTAVLHTWGQTLVQHLHLHCIVTGAPWRQNCWSSRPRHPPAPESVPALILRLTGVDLERSPVCQAGTIRRTDVLPPASVLSERPAVHWDTS